MSTQKKNSSVFNLVAYLIIAVAAVGIIIGILFLTGVLGGAKTPDSETETNKPITTDTVDHTTNTLKDEDGKTFTYTETTEKTNYVKIFVKGYGTVIAQLDPEQAPATVANFQKLISEKFYDGLIFHRVIPGFMIQGGDPKGDGTGGSPDTIIGEFKNNGYNNTIEHKRGVLSMARKGSSVNPSAYYNTASSQFFIVQSDYPSLNGDYAAFGHVLSGMDVVDEIVAVKRNSNDKPLSDVVMQKVTFVTVTYAG